MSVDQGPPRLPLLAVESSPVWVEAVTALAGFGTRPLRRALFLDPLDGRVPALVAAADAEAEVWVAAPDADEATAIRALADRAGLSLHVIAAGAADLVDRAAELPSFDLVAAPLGWGGLDPTGRARFATFLGHGLAPGGALLMGHDVPPCGAAAATLRQIFGLCWEAAAREGAADAATRTARCLDLAETLLQASHMLVRQMPDWAGDLAAIRTLPPKLFHRFWIAPAGPVWSMAQTGDLLAGVGFAAVAPANPLRLARGAEFSAEQLALVDAAPDPWRAAEIADLAIGRRRRADVFVKAGGPVARPDAVLLHPLATMAEAPSLVAGAGGPVALSRAAYGPVLAALEAAGGAVTLGDLAARLGVAPAALSERIGVLIAAGQLAPARHRNLEAASEASRRACAALGAAMPRATEPVLASPVIGGGLPASISAAARRRLVGD